MIQRLDDLLSLKIPINSDHLKEKSIRPNRYSPKILIEIFRVKRNHLLIIFGLDNENFLESKSNFHEKTSDSELNLAIK